MTDFADAHFSNMNFRRHMTALFLSVVLSVTSLVAESHWAYQPIKRPKAPSLEGNKIDSFLNARLAKAGVKPNGQATPKELIRRVSIVLTGLPPTPEQVQAFEARHAKDA